MRGSRRERFLLSHWMGNSREGSELGGGSYSQRQVTKHLEGVLKDKCQFGEINWADKVGRVSIGLQRHSSSELGVFSGN